MREENTMSARLAVLETFVDELRVIWSTNADNQSRMEKAKPLLERFVLEPALKAHSADWPSTEGHKNLLLYVDPDYDFVINAVVRVPGRKGSIHDHADAWVLYGLLDGTESLERYAASTMAAGPIASELSSVTTGTRARSIWSRHVIHAEQGGDTRSWRSSQPEARRSVLGPL
jgi:predicted metal-dependent enzyme (double-stranded beta helix superfamily)